MFCYLKAAGNHESKKYECLRIDLNRAAKDANNTKFLK